MITEKCRIFHLALLTNLGLSRILIKHFLVQRFSNYRSLVVRPITGQNQFSELQSTFFFSFNEIENVRGYHIHRRQTFVSCVHTLHMQGSQRVSMQNTLTVGHRSKNLETLLLVPQSSRRLQQKILSTQRVMFFVTISNSYRETKK